MAQLGPAGAGHHDIGGTTAAKGRLSVAPGRDRAVDAGSAGAFRLAGQAAASFDPRLMWDAAESGGDTPKNGGVR